MDPPWRCVTFHFSSIDPDGPGAARASLRPATDDAKRTASAEAAPGAWRELLAGCWREIAAETAPSLRQAGEHGALAYAGAVLGVVEHALIELVGDPSARDCCDPSGSLWCAAQALDASALVSHRSRPAAGRRFQALGIALERRVQEGPDRARSRALVAATARRAAQALEQLALGAQPPQRSLEELDEATVGLATIAIHTWDAGRLARRSGSSPQLHAVARGLAIHRRATTLLEAATGEARAASAEADGAGDWLALALSRPLPAGSWGVIDDQSADRVLRAESLSIVRSAWISRGALELLALRRLDGASQASLRRRARPAPHRLAAARAAARPVKALPTGISGAWRAHSLALARTVATYLRACASSERRFGQAREELLELLADCLVQADRIDVILGGDSDGGLHAFRK
jgi:hypothetical protein